MCGLYGFLSYGEDLPKKDELINALAQESALRGMDATGISYNSNSRLHIFKKNKSAYQLKLKVPEDAAAVMGHTRHTTQGNEKKNDNNHPFLGKTKDGYFSLAHNGVLMNDCDLRTAKRLPKTKIETDSYVAVQLIEQKNRLNMAVLKEMAETVAGSFSFSILDDKDNLYLMKGDSPIALLHFPKLKLYVYASTAQILWRAITETSLFEALQTGAYETIEIHEGTILKISPNGNLSSEQFEYCSYMAPRWWSYGDGYDMPITENAYLKELKSMANYFGYTADDIQSLYDEGYSCDEIEAFCYEISYGG